MEICEIKIECNFINDIKNQQKEILLKNGYKIDKKKDIILQYYNTVNRLIPPLNYEVEINPDFNISCKFSKVIKEIIYKLKNCENINNFLSKNIVNSAYNDLMLNNFGFYHLHLGDDIKNGFRSRTKELMLIYIKGTKVYVLGIFNHGNWLDDTKLKIFKKHWPELLEPFKLKNIKMLSNYSVTDRSELRKNKINIPIEIDGECYLFNLGISSDGSSINVVNKRNYLMNSVVEAQEKFIEKLTNYLGETSNEKKESFNGKLEIKAIFEENFNSFIVVEKNNKIIF